MKLYRGLRNIKGDRAVNFFFLRDRKIKSIDQTQLFEKQWKSFVKYLMFSMGRFAPQQKVKKKKISVKDNKQVIVWNFEAK